jgi:hypothetical protein
MTVYKPFSSLASLFVWRTGLPNPDKAFISGSHGPLIHSPEIRSRDENHRHGPENPLDSDYMSSRPGHQDESLSFH